MEDERSIFVRPYLLTGGRTGSATGDLPIEAMVVMLQNGAPPHSSLPPELAAIINRCGSPISVAEIAALERRPIGVARVLIADLIDAGYLSRCATTDPTDRDTVRRLINGLVDGR